MIRFIDACRLICLFALSLTSQIAFAQPAMQDVPLSYAGCSFVHAGTAAIESLDVQHAVFESCPQGKAQGWALIGAKSRLRVGDAAYPVDLVKVGWLQNGRFIGADMILLEIGGFVNISAMRRARLFQKKDPNYSVPAVLELIRSEAQVAGAESQAEAVKVMSEAARAWDANPAGFLQQYMRAAQDDRPARGRSARGG
jgi:hypothetical protein